MGGWVGAWVHGWAVGVTSDNPAEAVKLSASLLTSATLASASDFGPDCRRYPDENVIRIWSPYMKKDFGWDEFTAPLARHRLWFTALPPSPRFIPQQDGAPSPHRPHP